MTGTTRTKPRLTIVAGAPGSGIEPWLEAKRGGPLPKRFYDPDWLAHGIGDWDDETTRAAGADIMNKLVNSDIKARRSFGFRTSYANQAMVEAVCRLTAEIRFATDGGPSAPSCNNYAVHVYYIGTTTPTVNEARMREAAINRTTPFRKPAEIERLRADGMRNLKATINVLDQVTLIDGSDPMDVVAIARNGRPERHAKRIPAWARDILNGCRHRLTSPAKADAANRKTT